MVVQEGDSRVSLGGLEGPILTSVITQLSVAGLPTGAGGAWVLEVTVTDVEEVQPVLVLVMSKV